MAMQRTTAVGVFQDRSSAQQAINELKRSGFTEDQIGVTARRGDDDDSTYGATDDDDSETYAGEGGLAGLATGAGVGALWGLGIVAGLLPAIGPAIAGGTLAAILSSAAAGAAAAGLAGALIGLGIPKEEAEYYESEVKSGRVVVTVQAGTRYAEAAAILRRFGAYDAMNRTADTATATGATASSRTGHHAATAKEGDACGTTIQAREEELHVRKQPVESGEVRVRKEVHTEHKTLEVPVMKEEIVVEHRTPTGDVKASGTIGEDQEIRVPVREEQVHLEKQAVVKDEVRVGKRMVQDTEHVQGTVRKEEIHVDTQGDVDVRDERR